MAFAMNALIIVQCMHTLFYSSILEAKTFQHTKFLWLVLIDYSVSHLIPVGY